MKAEQIEQECENTDSFVNNLMLTPFYEHIYSFSLGRFSNSVKKNYGADLFGLSAWKGMAYSVAFFHMPNMVYSFVTDNDMFPVKAKIGITAVSIAANAVLSGVSYVAGCLCGDNEPQKEEINSKLEIAAIKTEKSESLETKLSD
jgi:hypothetical protein